MTDSFDKTVSKANKSQTLRRYSIGLTYYFSSISLSNLLAMQIQKMAVYDYNWTKKPYVNSTTDALYSDTSCSQFSGYK